MRRLDAATLVEAAAAAILALSTELLSAETASPPEKAKNTCRSPSGGGAGVEAGVRAAVMAAVPDTVAAAVAVLLDAALIEADSAAEAEGVERAALVGEREGGAS